MADILPLADRPDAIPQLARWFHHEWGAVDGRPPIEIERQLCGNLGRGGVPMTWLAVEGETVIGTVSLDLHDLPGYDHLSPWLACLYVVESHRGRGIARQLVTKVMSEAQRIGLPAVYLWTWNLEAYYQSLGWKTQAMVPVAGQFASLMRHDFSPQG